MAIVSITQDFKNNIAFVTVDDGTGEGPRTYTVLIGGATRHEQIKNGLDVLGQFCGTGDAETYPVEVEHSRYEATKLAAYKAAAAEMASYIGLECEEPYHDPYDRPKAFAYNRFVRGEYWVHGCDGHALLPNRIHDTRLSSPSALSPHGRHTSGVPP